MYIFCFNKCELNWMRMFLIKKGLMIFVIFNGYIIYNIKKVWLCVIFKINGKKKIRVNYLKYK